MAIPTLTHRILGVCLLGLSLLWTPAISAQEPGEGLLNAIRPQLKDPAKPFTLVVRLRIKAGSGAAFEKAFGVAMKATRKEPGCLSYELNRLGDSENEYLVYERWANLAAIKSHLASAHITQLLGQMPELTDGSPKLEIFLPAGE